jgi:membrane protein implicated in regulation of membrane protease activity
MKLVDRFGTLFLLAGLAYLGFYVYGLVMGVFSLTEAIGIGFTVLALFFAAAFVVHIVRVRRAMRDPEQHQRIMRELHTHRERRGF